MRGASASTLIGALFLISRALGATAAEPVVNSPPPFYLAAPAQPDARGTAQQPLVVNATLPGKTAGEKASEDAERAWRHTVDKWIIGASIATILVLIGQGIAFIFQAHRLKQSVDEMQKATKATQDVARAEQQTVDTMERTARRELKAYVFVESQDFDFGGQSGTDYLLTARVVLKNYGQTPAYNLRVLIAYLIAPEFKPQDPAEPLKLAGTLGPGATFQVDLKFRTPIADFGNIQTGSSVIFIYGRAEYEDAFKAARWLAYRLMSAAAVKGDLRRLLSCEDGNDSDAQE